MGRPRKVIGERAIFQQPVLTGGLNSTGSAFAPGDNATWLDAQNMIISAPIGYLSGVTTKALVPVTAPPTKEFGSEVSSFNSYANFVWQKTVATFENTDWPSESWAFSGTGTASLVAAISEGDQALSLANTAGQTAVGTGTLSPTVNLSSLTYGVLAVDTNWDNVSNFSSGYIRIGSDSSNYRQHDLSAPAGTGNNVLRFTFASPSSTTGTPSLGFIAYVQVSLTASGGGSITVKFDNLRIFSYVSAAGSTLVENGVNAYSSFVLDSDASLQSKQIFSSGDSLFISNSIPPVTDSDLTLSCVKGGFRNTSTYFYFSQFQKSGSLINNILYYANGSDGYFSYDPNASAGSRHARISSTAYKYICSHKNMMFLAGASSAPNTVQPSDINDPATLTAANAVVVPNVSGSYVTGLISMNDYLAILRNDGIRKLYGSNPASATTDFQLIDSASKVGCIEQRAACRVGNFIYFFSGSGIYRFDGNDSYLISEPVNNLLTGYHSKLCSMYYNPIRDGVVFNFVPSTVVDPETSKTSYYQLWYFPKLNAWGKTGAYDNANSVQFFGLAWGGSLYSKPIVYNGGLQLYQVDPTTPTDISMPWYLQTQFSDQGTPGINKDYDSLYVFIRDQAGLTTPSVTVTTYTDQDPSTARDTFTSQTPVNGVIGPLYLANSLGRTFSVKVAGTCDDQKDEAVELSGYSVTYTERGLP